MLAYASVLCKEKDVICFRVGALFLRLCLHTSAIFITKFIHLFYYSMYGTLAGIASWKLVGDTSICIFLS